MSKLFLEYLERKRKDNNKQLSEKIIKKIKNIKIDTLTPIKALNILSELKEILKNE